MFFVKKQPPTQYYHLLVVLRIIKFRVVFLFLPGLFEYHANDRDIICCLQVGRWGSFISSLRCWRIQTCPTACPGYSPQPASSNFPPRTRTKWRHCGGRERATRGPWPTRRCPAPWGTTPGPERSSRWRRSSPTSSARTPWCRCRRGSEETHRAKVSRC